MPGLRAHHYLNCYHLVYCFVLQVPTCLLSCHVLTKDRALEGNTMHLKFWVYTLLAKLSQ